MPPIYFHTSDLNGLQRNTNCKTNKQNVFSFSAGQKTQLQDPAHIWMWKQPRGTFHCLRCCSRAGADVHWCYCATYTHICPSRFISLCFCVFVLEFKHSLPKLPPGVLTICCWRLGEQAQLAAGHVRSHFGQRDALLPRPQHRQLRRQFIFKWTIGTMTNGDTAGGARLKKWTDARLTSHDDRDLLLELISHRLRQKRNTMNMRLGCRPLVFPQSVETQAALNQSV